MAVSGWMTWLNYNACIWIFQAQFNNNRISVMEQATVVQARKGKATPVKVYRISATRPLYCADDARAAGAAIP